jgi:hypothetical protein
MTFCIHRADQGYNIQATTLQSKSQVLDWMEDNHFNWTGPDAQEEVRHFLDSVDLEPGMTHRISSGCILVCTGQ